MGTERVIVFRSIAEEFAHALKKEAEAIAPVAGNAVTVAGAYKTQALVDAAVKQGARLDFGQNLLRDGALQPTVLSGVTRDMDFFYTESFGPTVSVTVVDTVDEAVALANDTGYGLSGSVFSRDISKAVRVAKRIETGACHINAMTVHDESLLPHGGVKESGFGRFGGLWGMNEFLQIKTITILDDHADS
jgi:acyl-CoA reductase-like NAD-dependent aldehyde dehydrogenase